MSEKQLIFVGLIVVALVLAQVFVVPFVSGLVGGGSVVEAATTG